MYESQQELNRNSWTKLDPWELLHEFLNWMAAKKFIFEIQALFLQQSRKTGWMINGIIFRRDSLRNPRRIQEKPPKQVLKNFPNEFLKELLEEHLKDFLKVFPISVRPLKRFRTYYCRWKKLWKNKYRGNSWRKCWSGLQRIFQINFRRGSQRNCWNSPMNRWTNSWRSFWTNCRINL